MFNIFIYLSYLQLKYTFSYKCFVLLVVRHIKQYEYNEKTHMNFIHVIIYFICLFICFDYVDTSY